MSDFTTVKTQIRKLIDEANAKTGKADADLTGAVGSLVEGYGGGSGGGNIALAENIVNITSAVEITSYDLGTHAYYNGELLPLIPLDLLTTYPYTWIRKNTTSGYYDLLLSTTKWYYSGTDMDIDGTTGSWYRVSIDTASEVTEWVFNMNISTGNFAINESQTILWSIQDIPNGSEGANEIYFASTMFVPV